MYIETPTDKKLLTYRHFHLEIVSMEFEENVWKSALEECVGPQHQDQP